MEFVGGLAQEVKSGNTLDYKTEVALNVLVPLFEVDNKTVPEVIKQLNLVSPIPINAEMNIEKSTSISFVLQNTKIQGILNEFVQRSNAKWYSENNMVNIIDTAVERNPQNAMNSVLSSFKITKKSKMEAAQELFTRPKILKRKFYVVFTEVHSSTVVERAISLSSTEVTPRQVLNTIVAADGQSYWAIYSQEGAHYFTFNKRS